MKISLVLPIYNEQLDLPEVLAKYVTDLKATGAEYEIICVNDGSTDDTLKILKNVAKLNRSLRIINFDARYGKQAAITAGMDAAKGDCVILADIDIFNPIGILQKVYKEFRAGAPIVHAYRERFGRSHMKSRWSQAFVRFATAIFGIPGRYTGKVHIALYSRDVADVLVSLPEKNKLLRTMDMWVDYKIKPISYASGYNKTEERAKTRAAHARLKKQGKELPARDSTREHTASKIYGIAFFLIALALLGVVISLLVFTELVFVYHFFMWVILLAWAIIGLMFYARSALIKRIGVIHNNLSTGIYKIESVINPT